ncbi:MAG: hypothetical protein IJ589_01775 [Lachnospiraceae bacterium]|nr:hypothetical protein [Lachnospiraceae bacterium]
MALVQLFTNEGKQLHRNPKEIPWDVYPRPKLVRDSFMNLNGFWDFTVMERGRILERFDRQIRVPFPPESLLSGINEHFPENSRLVYRKRFILTDHFVKDRVILHIGAADQVAEVEVDGELVTVHEGGYQHIDVDITKQLRNGAYGEHTLIIRVRDNLKDHAFPYGKQTLKRGGMWYTPVSGIWQSVWLESVPEKYFTAIHASVKLTEEGNADVIFTTEGTETEGKVRLETTSGPLYGELRGGRCNIRIGKDVLRLWSPADPYLYHVSVKGDQDFITSYVTIRTLEIKTVKGISRLCLNGKPVFFHALLDQGYFSDGLFTPASPEVLEKELLGIKSLGYNAIRKHIKVEPDQFYYLCDQMGILVMQDMVNNGDYHFLRDTAIPNILPKGQKASDVFMHEDKRTREMFIRCMKQTYEQLKDYNCICYWTIFNEGWGQFHSTKVYREFKELEKERFVDATSGWFKCGESDIESVHIYGHPYEFEENERPVVLSEFGGLSCRIEDHVFNPDKTYGYGKSETPQTLPADILKMYEQQVFFFIERGLSGCVYTQVSDVEDEINGLVTYDRKVMKVDHGTMNGIANTIFRLFEKCTKE